jgi:Holliday junction resolvase RusA-like endonuclease
MPITYALNLPLPPPANAMWRHQTGRMKVSSTGKRFAAPVTLSDRYKEWLDRAGWLVKQQMVGLPPDGLIQGRFSVLIEYPLTIRGDEDSYEKPIFDLLQRTNVIRNDKGIYGHTVARVDRQDVMIALTDLGGEPLPINRKARTWSKPRPERPTAARIAAIGRIRAKTMF